MENLNVVLSLILFLGIGSSLIHFASARLVSAKVLKENRLRGECGPGKTNSFGACNNRPCNNR